VDFSYSLVNSVSDFLFRRFQKVLYVSYFHVRNNSPNLWVQNYPKLHFVGKK